MTEPEIENFISLAQSEDHENCALAIQMFEWAHQEVTLVKKLVRLRRSSLRIFYSLLYDLVSSGKIGILSSAKEMYLFGKVEAFFVKNNKGSLFLEYHNGNLWDVEARC